MSRKRRSPHAAGLNIPAFRSAFYDFLDHVTIVSKDTGRGRIRLFSVQSVLLDGGYGQEGIFDALAAGVHWVVTLKARQLGITTVSLLFDVFWAAMFPGLQGAIVADTPPNIRKIRLLLEDVLDHLPESHRLPIISHNRDGIVFDTPGGTSMIDYLTAGLREGAGNLGRSRALNFCHMTEVSSYGGIEGFESLKNTFSEVWPYRLYHMESTARGLNIFHEEWEDACEDTLTKRALFLAWWMHDQYAHERGSPLFERYGHDELDPDEEKVAAAVLAEHGYVISPEQWAWYRHRRDPRARQDHQSARDEREEIVEQEYPSYPEQAFIMTGSSFIQGAHLTPHMKRGKATLFKGYRYRFGENVTRTERIQVEFARQAHLKVFQDPVPGAVYIVAADPAYAASDESDRFCVQVIRCYADRVDQVAVFCERNMESFEFVWVIIDLCAYYGNCRFILEINSCGVACLSEFKHLKTQIENGLLNPPRADPMSPTTEELQGEHDTRNMLSRVRQYLYRRPDSFIGGFNLQWKTDSSNKPAMMIQFRDRIVLGELVMVDVETIKEVQTLRQDGIIIKAEGHKKDDRAIALALAVRCWIDQERNGLEAMGRTYAAEQARVSEDGNLLASRYMMRMLQGEMAGRARQREQTQRFERRGRWGW